ncbi:Porin-like protein L precursor [Grimontia celer]|uniref:Porin-like protein L n=1 Tax=Grimontia celer TaxID=1796497 RepID=A0A128F0T7_9GAMM|nr:porin [Grimontia celer]CZF79866.1 Porin-like protein L precursor [Grimontia celer]
MKKLALASAILATFASSLSHAATVYQDEDSTLEIGGRAEARFNISDKNETAENSSFNDISRARINVAGETKVNDDVSVFGFYEGELTTEDSSISNRYMFAGFDTTWGAFSYGKQDSAQVMLTDTTDILYTFGGDAADLIEGNQDKRDNNFVYTNTFADAFTLSLNHVQSDEKDNYSTGAAFAYEMPFGLQLGLGYVDGKQDDRDANQLNVTAAYTLNDFYLGALYATGEVDNDDMEAWEVAASYTMNSVIFQYAFNYKDIDNTSRLTDADEFNYHAVEVAYKATKNFTTYAGYKFDNQKVDGKSQDDEIQMGLRYDF